MVYLHVLLFFLSFLHSFPLSLAAIKDLLPCLKNLPLEPSEEEVEERSPDLDLGGEEDLDDGEGSIEDGVNSFEEDIEGCGDGTETLICERVPEFVLNLVVASIDLVNYC